MIRIMIITMILALNIACAPAQSNRIDEVPMYGGIDRSTISDLKIADDKLIADTSDHYGSREKAARAFIDQGFNFYNQDRLGMAMRRFNQAWILDPNNPQVYWGFGSVLHNQEKMCESMKHYEKALSFNQHITGMYPDAGRVISLCAVQNQKFSAEDREKLHERADGLYAEAARKDLNKGYVFLSWASVYYWREQYSKSWTMVKKAQENGGQPPPQFLSLLRNKMPEP